MALLLIKTALDRFFSQASCTFSVLIRQTSLITESELCPSKAKASHLAEAETNELGRSRSGPSFCFLFLCCLVELTF